MKISVIGPRSVGKSTISKMLSEKLGYTYVESDFLMDREMAKYGGLDKAIKSGKEEIILRKGPEVVEKALKEDGIVFDLAGGAIGSRKGAKLGVVDKVIQTLGKESYVVGLLPFENDEESVELLYQREREREHFKSIDKDELHEKVRKDYFKLKPKLIKVANLIIYVKQKSPELVVEEINQKLSGVLN